MGLMSIALFICVRFLFFINLKVNVNITPNIICDHPHSFVIWMLLNGLIAEFSNWIVLITLR